MDDEIKPELTYLHWDITGRCNLKCIHCRATSSEEDKEFTREEGIDFIKGLKAFDLEWLSFDGGEPLLRKDDLLQFVKTAKEQGLFTYLLTNGLLLDESIAGQLKEAGLGSIQVSLDGLKKTHNRIRGKGSFEKAVRGIKTAKKAGHRITARITLNKFNLDEAKDLLEFVIELGCEAFGIRRFIPCGRAIDNISDLEIDKQRYLEVIQSCVKKAGKRIQLQIGADPVLIPRTYLIEQIKKEYGTTNILAGCGAGITMCHVNSEGDVYPCSTLPISAGNIRKQDLGEIWKNGEIFKVLREGRKNLKGHCGECKYTFSCGGCRASALYYKNDVLEYDPYCLVFED